MTYVTIAYFFTDLFNNIFLGGFFKIDIYGFYTILQRFNKIKIRFIFHK